MPDGPNDPGEMRPDYDFTGAVRGKYADRYVRMGVRIDHGPSAAAANPQADQPMTYPTFIHVPVFDSSSPDKPKMVWINPHHFMYLEDRGNYTAAHTYGEGAYHILLPFRELMLLINPEWHG